MGIGNYCPKAPIGTHHRARVGRYARVGIGTVFNERTGPISVAPLAIDPSRIRRSDLRKILREEEWHLLTWERSNGCDFIPSPSGK